VRTRNEVALVELDEAQELRGYAEMEEVVGLELELGGQHREVA